MKIYVLKCENNKYYVGRTKNIEKRIIQHFTLNGSKWTKKYKPIKIINQYDGDEFDEEKHTLLTMDKYGIENVRGGSYCKMKLSKYDIDKIQQIIYSIMDKCYKCGKKGHFANDCGKNIIYDKSNTNNCTHRMLGYRVINNKREKENYEKFCENCDGECKHCRNVRMIYVGNQGDGDYGYVSCPTCYNGNDWDNDMFVIISKNKEMW